MCIENCSIEKKKLCKLTMHYSKREDKTVYDYWSINAYLDSIYSNIVDYNFDEPNLIETILKKYMKNGSYCYIDFAEILYQCFEKRYMANNPNVSLVKQNAYITVFIDLLFRYYGKPHDPKNYLRKLYLKSINDIDKLSIEEERNFLNSINNYKYNNKTEKEQLTKSRRAQYILRRKLLLAGKSCIICGINKKEFLEACHIKPWRISNRYERQDLYNGFLMCKNHHIAFDSGFITFEDSGKIIISDRLDEDTRNKIGINNNIKIKVYEENKKYLKINRELFYANEKKKNSIINSELLK